MLSRKNFYISSKIFFTLISLIMLIPLTFLTIFFDFYSLRLLNREIASANRNALFLYQEQLEADLSQIETSMAQNWATNWNYQKLKYKLDPLDVHLNTLSIVNKAREQLALTECLGAVYIYSAPNDVCRCAGTAFDSVHVFFGHQNLLFSIKRCNRYHGEYSKR